MAQRLAVEDLEYLPRSDGGRRNLQSSTATPQTLPYSLAAFELPSPNECGAIVTPVEHHECQTYLGSKTNLSQCLAPGDISDLDDDPFFGASLASIDPASPSFLDESFYNNNFGLPDSRNIARGTPTYPLTPAQTASIHTTSPQCDRKDLGTEADTEIMPDSVSPYQLQKPFMQNPLFIDQTAVTPMNSESTLSSDDLAAPTSCAMNPQSPRVTVSVWDKDHDALIHAVERTLGDDFSAAHEGWSPAGDLITTTHDTECSMPGLRNPPGDSSPAREASRSGLDPCHRPPGEVNSINEIASRRHIEQRNQEVDQWLSENLGRHDSSLSGTPADITSVDDLIKRQGDVDDGKGDDDDNEDDDDDLPLGSHTENRQIPGQTYFHGPGGHISSEDRDIIASNRVWGDAPLMPNIEMGKSGRFQPETSQDAIKRWEAMCRDNDSMISRSATWGTRRRSLPSAVDVEGITSGNFLKKLSIQRGNGDKTSRPGSFLGGIKGFVRGSSVNQLRKRSRSRSHGQSLDDGEDAPCRQGLGRSTGSESAPHLSPSMNAAGGERRPAPSINTTLASVGQNIASMLTSHSRGGSVTSASPVTSPKTGSGNLSVRNSFRRPRSKSDIPKATGSPNLVEIWRRSGGPPVAPVIPLGHKHAEYENDEDDDEDEQQQQEEDEEDEEEGEAEGHDHGEGELRNAHTGGANFDVIDSVTPDLSGFSQHIIRLNPALEHANQYLVERIARQQVVRYKQLLSAKVKHLGCGANCPCGPLCVALGGTAMPLNARGSSRGNDAGSSLLDLEEDDGASMEGAISQDNFPQGIPMPPTRYLPAELECQLCFRRKKFSKPSDWTKHVHEDVQPFTCTWANCKDHQKIFKRKADWVRHENEGHRHLEWWTCDVDDCRHVCYRKDNFLQHLEREHKFPKPKPKTTKAAARRGGDMDGISGKVEQCHKKTSASPQGEPCRFCGRVFHTWKKLTVHLAKHMEQITLPILRLTARAEELTADTVISPIRDPPPQTQTSCTPSGTFSSRQQHGRQLSAQQLPQQWGHRQGHDMTVFQPAAHLAYASMAQGQFPQQSLFSRQMESMIPNSSQPILSLDLSAQAIAEEQEQLQGIMPSHPGGYLAPHDPFANLAGNEVEAFPELDALGLHGIDNLPIGSQLAGESGYDALLNASGVDGSTFGGHESLPTYTQPAPQITPENVFGRRQQQQQQQPSSWDQRHPYI